MSGEPTITIVGRVGKEIRYAEIGRDNTPVLNFSVATNPRVKNKQTDQWENGETIWFQCTAWRDHAINIQDAIETGTELLLTGRVTLKKWERNGKSGENFELAVEHVGTLISPWASKEDKERATSDVWSTPSSYDDETPF